MELLQSCTKPSMYCVIVSGAYVGDITLVFVWCPIQQAVLRAIQQKFLQILTSKASSFFLSDIWNLNGHFQIYPPASF